MLSKEKKTNVITRSVAFAIVLGILEIHRHVLIVCKLVKPFECSIRKKVKKKTEETVKRTTGEAKAENRIRRAKEGGKKHTNY